MGDNWRLVLAKLRAFIVFATSLGLSLNANKSKLTILGPNTSLSDDIIREFNDLLPSITVTKVCDLEMLGAPIGQDALDRVLNEKLISLRTLCKGMEHVDAHEAFYFIKNCLFVPKLLYTLRTAPTFRRSDILTLFDEAIRSTLQTVLNVHLDEQTWQQLTLPVKCAGMGMHNVTELSTLAFLSSVSKSRALVESIIKTRLPETDLREAADKWWLLVGGDETAPDICD